MYIHLQNSTRPSAHDNSVTENCSHLAAHTQCQSLAQPHLPCLITSVSPQAHAASPRHRHGSNLSANRLLRILFLTSLYLSSVFLPISVLLTCSWNKSIDWLIDWSSSKTVLQSLLRNHIVHRNAYDFSLVPNF